MCTASWAWFASAKALCLGLGLAAGPASSWRLWRLGRLCERVSRSGALRESGRRAAAARAQDSITDATATRPTVAPSTAAEPSPTAADAALDAPHCQSDTCWISETDSATTRESSHYFSYLALHLVEHPRCLLRLA